MPRDSLRRFIMPVACIAAIAAAFGVARPPEPDPVPRRWQVDLQPGALRMASVDIGDGPKLYYYLTYKVVNTSGGDVLFAPLFEMGTDNGRVLRAGREVPAQVTEELLSRLENPFLEDQISILGLLLQGEENAKEGLVVWPVADMGTDEVAVYGAGFSGETKVITSVDAATGEPKPYTLRKQLMLRYPTPGDLDGKGSDPLEPGEKRWILR